MRTAAIALTVVAVLALVPVLISLQSGSEANADEDAATVPVAGAQGPVPEAQTGANAATPQEAVDAGRLTESEKNFLVAVRQAGLWEIPAGQMAQTQAGSAAVKRAGHHLIEGHAKLDQLVREDAKMLNVQLPDKATEEQQGWVAQMKAAEGAEFDKLFANLLRASHGKIFTTIAQVRGGTQNDIIRRHARQANQTVLDHIEVLEDTGLVDPETFEEVEAAVTK
ncbi:hypothetical protein CRI70_24155 [Streptomyces sp. Ru87]|uniref:DUF4142 domain-containing protein n=2 Tax=Streptomyces TaxID=1883 RepID=A0ABQ7FKY8_9ACTN|nr:DUF4142 domain-containing protein [Streptomyces lycii]PGH48241.1 hypothetical protein CRI70_24155 [Streptomyces sp. Ru87]